MGVLIDLHGKPLLNTRLLDTEYAIQAHEQRANAIGCTTVRPVRTLSMRRGSMLTGLPFLVENLERPTDEKPESPYRLFPASDREVAAHLGLPMFDHIEEGGGVTRFCDASGASVAEMPSEDWAAQREVDP